MGKSDKQTQTQTQATESAPWAPTIDPITKLINQISGQNPALTGGQTSALNNLQTAAGEIPNFGSDASGAVAKMFGMDTDPQIGLLNDTLSEYKANIGGTASGAELDPYATPGFGTALDTLSSDITKKVKGVYAGSGRDPSGAGSFAGTLGRGLTEGMAPVIADQFNKNKANQMAAAGNLYGAGGSTATGITGQQSSELASNRGALDSIGLLSQAFMSPGTSQLAAADAAQGKPLENINAMLAPLLQAAGLGGTSSGNSSGTVSQPQNTMSNIMGGVSGSLGILKLMGLSDERAKDDVEPIGLLNDGQNVIRFRYKGEPQMRIGLLAQDVEKYEPGAVTEIGGLKVVDHKKATDRAAAMRKAA